MIKKEGGKWVLFSKDGDKKLGEFDTEAAAKEREKEIQAFKHQSLVEIPLVITKASLHEDGTMRWCATVSDTQPDRTGERTSLALFQDWIERVEKGLGVDFLPPPRVPFLGVSHYPSFDGDGEAGITEKMYIDGKQFKVSGVFMDTPLGRAVFETVRHELDIIKRGETITANPIRISAAWWDLEHSHGEFKFPRRSLVEQCPMCAKGAGDKVYLKGQPDHWAATRVPINPRTALELEEKSMVTRRDDAASIVGDEHADELESKAQELVGKSEAEETPALVVKADEAATLTEPDAEKAHGEAMGDEYGYRPLGGATSLAEADAFIAAQEMQDRLFTNWDLVNTIFFNILEDSAEDKMQMVSDLHKDFSDRVGTLKANITDAFLIAQAMVSATAQPQPAKVETVEKGDNIVTEEIETTEQPEVQPVVNDPSAILGTSVQTALSNPSLTREAKLEAIQGALNDYAGAVKAQLDAVAPLPPGEEIVNAIERSMGAFAERMELLFAKLGDGQPIAPTAVPQQKSFAPTGPVQSQTGQELPISPITGKPSALRAHIERSVIGH